MTLADLLFFSSNQNKNKARFDIVRLLLLNGASPEDARYDRTTALQLAREKAEDQEIGAFAIVREMELYLENPTRYRSDHSALIQLAIGLASLDLPVLIVTIISEYLVSINEEKLYGQYSEQKSWILQR